MLYLEDYLEMIENLPMEMRERFTEMREVDLEVQNSTDTLEEKVKSFFKKCAVQGSVKQEWKDEQFDKIKSEYQKSLESADDKVQLANQIYDMVDRHLRKLDQELSKFKMELEADNAGITELLEKRSLELDSQIHTGHRGEKRKYTHHNTQSSFMTNHIHEEKQLKTEKLLSSVVAEVVRDSVNTSDSVSPSTEMLQSRQQPQQTPANNIPGFSYSLGQMGAQSNALAAAASAAIAATKQMQQGRRTASLKASYDVITKGAADVAREFTFTGNENVGSPATLAEGRSQRTKKQTQKAAELIKQQQIKAASILNKSIPAPVLEETDIIQPELVEPLAEVPTTVPAALDESGNPVNWTYDPNEPRYCICNDVSYGEMVGCDNDDCPIEWFHYACVGLTAGPKGKWYCPQCLAAMKRRGRK